MADSSNQSREQRRRAREYEARIVVNDVQQDRRRNDNRTALIVFGVVAVLSIVAVIGFSISGGQTSVAEAPDPVTTESADPLDPASPDPANPDPANPDPASPDQANPAESAVPDPAIAEDREWTGQLTLNGSIDLGISIDGANAPQSAANFIALSQSGFYTDTPCHRLTTEGLYVLQCGDPTGTGTGGPGYAFGPLENIPADDTYPAGTIAMARSMEPDSMGSQFFIVYEDTVLPAPGYTVFGQVTSGLEQLVSEVVEPGVDAASSGATGDGPPLVPVTITDITLQ